MCIEVLHNLGQASSTKDLNAVLTHQMDTWIKRAHGKGVVTGVPRGSSLG